MPPDTRRITAPFTTVDYRIYSNVNSGLNIRDTIKQARPDGRHYKEHRAIGIS